MYEFFDPSAVFVYLVIVNFVAIVMFVRDKIQSKSKNNSKPSRIPERDLLLISAIGGSIGAMFAMKIARHKTRKPSFLIPFWVIVVVQVVAVGYLIQTVS